MTRKDYVAIAQAMRASLDASETPESLTVWAKSVHAIADVFARDNARFDREKFLLACGFAYAGLRN